MMNNVQIYDATGITGFYRSTSTGSYSAFYFIKNIQGDVVAVINSLCQIQAQYSYDAYGKKRKRRESNLEERTTLNCNKNGG